MPVLLNVTAGPHAGQQYRFQGHDTFLVGRSKQAHFQLADSDRAISRIHFMIEFNPPECRLMDMNSHNGTHVNGQRVETIDLKTGDIIRAGKTMMEVRIELEETVSFSPADSSSEPVTKWEKEKSSAFVPKNEVNRQGETPTIQGYAILKELGQGGMGIVYLATMEDGSQVAIKTIKPRGDVSAKQVKRFLREAEILRQLHHPHIVEFKAMGEAEGTLFFVMEYIPGKDANQLIRDNHTLAVKPALRIMIQALQALDYAHRRGFVHRDVKPANLLLEKTASGIHAHLADFGLARVYQSSKLSGLTATGEVGGTFNFMPPEQITHFRDVNPLSDQFAAAASLYHLLTAKFIHDFSSSRQKPVVLILEHDAIPISERGINLPDGLEEVIHRALQRNPRKRFRSAAAFARELEAFT